MSTLMILLSAFVLSVVALGVFIWSQRRGLLDRSPQAAEVIFAAGEIGRIEEPSIRAPAQRALQAAVSAAIGVSAPHAEIVPCGRAPGASSGPG